MLSTPCGWVWFGAWVTLVGGVVLGILSARVTQVLTPRPRAQAAAVAV